MHLVQARVSPSSSPRTASVPTADGRWVLAPSGLWVPMFPRLVVPPPSPSRIPREQPPPVEELVALQEAQGTDRERLHWLNRVVGAITWSPRNPAIRRALEERAQLDACSVAEVKHRELRAAAYLALAERVRPQTHRFGRSWLTDRRGRSFEVVPERLPAHLFWRWFTDETRKAAEASLLGRPYPLVGTEPRTIDTWKDVALDELPGVAADPLFVLVQREERVEAERLWTDVLASATPRQRDLLAALADGLENGETLCLSAAAARLGVAPSTARVQWKRLLDRRTTLRS